MQAGGIKAPERAALPLRPVTLGAFCLPNLLPHLQPLRATPQIGLGFQQFKFGHQISNQIRTIEKISHLIVIQLGTVIEIAGAHETDIVIAEKKLCMQFAIVSITPQNPDLPDWTRRFSLIGG